MPDVLSSLTRVEPRTSARSAPTPAEDRSPEAGFDDAYARAGRRDDDARVDRTQEPSRRPKRDEGEDADRDAPVASEESKSARGPHRKAEKRSEGGVAATAEAATAGEAVLLAEPSEPAPLIAGPVVLEDAAETPPPSSDTTDVDATTIAVDEASAVSADAALLIALAAPATGAEESVSLAEDAVLGAKGRDIAAAPTEGGPPAGGASSAKTGAASAAVAAAPAADPNDAAAGDTKREAPLRTDKSGDDKRESEASRGTDASPATGVAQKPHEKRHEARQAPDARTDLAVAPEKTAPAAQSHVASRIVAPSVAAASGAEAAAQVVAAIRAESGKDTIEVRLDPPELGRVRIELNIDRSDRVTATVSSERSDTLDLMRRHQDELARELERAGFARVRLDFASGDSGKAFSQSSPQGAFASGAVDAPVEAAPARLVQYLSLRTDNRLDRVV